MSRVLASPVVLPSPAPPLLILNLRSGGAARIATALSAAARRAGVQMAAVRRPADLSLLVRSRLQAGAGDFIVAGGDGTLRHVIEPLVGTGATVGVIPLGTYNRFARDAGIPLDWREALHVALHGERRPVDVGVVNGVPFLSAVTLGVHPVLLEERERLRDRGSVLALTRAIATAMVRFPRAAVTLACDGFGLPIDAPVVTVSVNRVAFHGPGLPGRDALDGGVLSAWWIESDSRLALAARIAALLAGRAKLAGVRQMSGTRITVACDHGQLGLGLDGEMITMRTPLVIGVRRRALFVRTNGTL